MTPNLKASRGEAERVALEQQGMRKERTVEGSVGLQLVGWRRRTYWCLLGTDSAREVIYVLRRKVELLLGSTVTSFS
jgi:hypothetical protein